MPLSHMFDLSSSAASLVEQICYVQCGFCTTILLVSVPCSSMSMVVTVRCGHCTSLLSVNMIKASFVPFHLLSASLDHRDHDIVTPPPRHQSLNEWQEEVEEVASPEAEEDHEEGDQKGTLSLMNSGTSDDNNEDHEDSNTTNLNRIINKPPEKRQRAPSAYNCFIKEEIKRLKSENPTMAHKEAFSMAAKNWAHFPPVHYRVEEDGDGDQIRLNEPRQIFK